MSESEELILGRKTWKKSMDAVEKDGFREGFEVGRRESFQEGFNLGFKTAFGMYYGHVLQSTKAKLIKNSSTLKEVPEDKPVCIICSEKDSDELLAQPLESIIQKQKNVFQDL